MTGQKKKRAKTRIDPRYSLGDVLPFDGKQDESSSTDGDKTRRKTGLWRTRRNVCPNAETDEPIRVQCIVMDVLQKIDYDLYFICFRCCLTDSFSFFYACKRFFVLFIRRPGLKRSNNETYSKKKKSIFQFTCYAFAGACKNFGFCIFS